MVDTRTVAAVSTIKTEAWELLPSSRSYEDMGKLAPGIRVSGIPDVGGSKTGGGRGSLINYGSNDGGSTLMFDGVNTDGVAGYYDVGAIEEMVVRAAGNDPEIATPGMTFQTIVKSGGNQFHGMAFGAFQTRGMQGNNVTDELRAARVTAGNPMDHYFDLNASLGGRLIRDKLWFFTSIRNKEYVDEPIGFARDPGPDGLWWTGDEPPGQVKNSESSGRKPSGFKLKYQMTDKQALSYMHYANTKFFDGNDADQNHNGDSVHPQVHWNQIYNAEYTYTPWSNGIVNASFGNAGWHSQTRAVGYRRRPDPAEHLRHGDAALDRSWMGQQVGRRRRAHAHGEQELSLSSGSPTTPTSCPAGSVSNTTSRPASTSPRTPTTGSSAAGPTKRAERTTTTWPCSTTACRSKW